MARAGKSWYTSKTSWSRTLISADAAFISAKYNSISCQKPGGHCLLNTYKVTDLVIPFLYYLLPLRFNVWRLTLSRDSRRLRKLFSKVRKLGRFLTFSVIYCDKCSFISKRVRVVKGKTSAPALKYWCAVLIFQAWANIFRSYPCLIRVCKVISESNNSMFSVKISL